MTYTPSGDQTLCYEFDWHRGPECVVSLVWASVPMLYCSHCRIAAHVDLVGTHITIASSAIIRPEPTP